MALKISFIVRRISAPALGSFLRTFFIFDTCLKVALYVFVVFVHALLLVLALTTRDVESKVIRTQRWALLV